MTSCSPCTPLRPDSNTSRGMTALAAYSASNTRITGYVGGTDVAGAHAASLVSLVAAAYRPIDSGSMRARERPVARSEIDAQVTHGGAAYGFGVVSCSVQVGIHLPAVRPRREPRLPSPAPPAPPRRWASPTCG